MDVKSLSALLLEGFYVLTGILMILTALFVIKDNKHTTRIGTACFWGILGIIFIFGKYIPSTYVGILILVVGVLTVTKQVNIGTLSQASDESRKENAKKIGGKIFIPSISLAILAFAIAQYTELGGQVAIGISALGGLGLTFIITKSPVKYVGVDSNRMIQQVGPSSILPQLLGALGTVFTAAGVGEVISSGISSIIPEGNILFGVIAYCLGMAVFTIIMGNAFAAFAVITAGIGIPFVFSQGADPVMAGALALTAGYCGTLLTPMAANFNVVPAALLEMKDKNGVIKAQAPVAITLLIIHIVLMYFLAF
ncbi:DUF979 domain-containing protein [Clostridium sporogenes]|uniref:DUF979 domain-containing protein n=1 Tax=Clostridium sporogenes TaxID=1509 RepID=UPI0013D1C3D3|nr:DUF979 domain-containing protein [Clostridium sporogenes]MBA4509035.1 DUF979 domain-containing protein [Clostridium sporogenes]MDU6336472.1 DUF979 domain-containing protein [Clostridium sporogenes]NFQ84931.1 DUF979 domain-containing protein [Clostridium sporogenes]